MFELPEKTVILTFNPIAVNKNFMGVENHDGAFMFTGTSQSWVLPLTQNGRFIDPFAQGEKGRKEKEYLEQELGLNLNFRDRNSDFNDIRVSIKKLDPDLKYLKKELNLSDPQDYLEYLVLKVQPDVVTWDNRNKGVHFRWLLKTNEEEVDYKITKAEYKGKAYSWLESNKELKQKLFEVLKVYGTEPNITESAKELYLRITAIIETDSLPAIRSLVDVIQDEDFDVKVFIKYAILAGALYNKDTRYYLITGESQGDKIGNTLDEAITYLRDPANSVVKQGIKARIALYKKENGLK